MVKNKKKIWTDIHSCGVIVAQNSQEDDVSRGGLQDNGWPEQYIIQLNIHFIRKNKTEPRDHITLQSEIHALLEIYRYDFLLLVLIVVKLLQYIALVVNN